MFGLKKLLNEMQFSDEESQKTLLQLFYFAGCFDEPLLKHSLAFSGFDEFQIQLMTLTIQHAMKTTDFKSIDNFQHDIISTSPHFLASEFDDETEFNKTKTWCSILLAQLKSQQALLLSTFEKEIDAMIEAGRKATTYQLAMIGFLLSATQRRTLMNIKKNLISCARKILLLKMIFNQARLIKSTNNCVQYKKCNNSYCAPVLMLLAF
jgi:hypothetical protein